MGDGKIVKLQEGKQDVSQVEIDHECGLQVESKTEIQKGDVLDFYKNIEI